MRFSRKGFSLFSVFSSLAFLMACSGNGSSSLLGDDSETEAGLTKAADGEAFLRAPFHLPSLAEDGAVEEPPAGEPSAPVSGDILNTGFEDQSAACWNDRAVGEVNSAGCGKFFNMGKGPFRLDDGGTAHTGSKAIQITYAKNEEMGGTDVAINAEAVNVRSWYYFDQGFDFGQGIKIGRVSSFNAAKHANDIDIILEVRSAQSSAQCGLTEMRDVGLFFNGAPKGSDWGSVAAPMAFQRGRWYAVEYQVILNAPGKADGIIRLWVDGDLKAEKKGLSIRGTLASKLNTVKIGGWYSNGAHGNTCANPSSPSRLYMDDVVIARNFIGTR